MIDTPICNSGCWPKACSSCRVFQRPNGVLTNFRQRNGLFLCLNCARKEVIISFHGTVDNWRSLMDHSHIVEDLIVSWEGVNERGNRNNT